MNQRQRTLEIAMLATIAVAAIAIGIAFATQRKLEPAPPAPNGAEGKAK